MKRDCLAAAGGGICSLGGAALSRVPAGGASPSGKPLLFYSVYYFPTMSAIAVFGVICTYLNTC